MTQSHASTLVEYERDGEIVTLTLNRPDKLNAFNDELVGALSDALHRFDMEDEAHIAILTGSGRAFSSGADVKQRQLRSREEFPEARRAAGARNSFRRPADQIGELETCHRRPARLCAGPLGRYRFGM